MHERSRHQLSSLFALKNCQKCQEILPFPVLGGKECRSAILCDQHKISQEAIDNIRPCSTLVDYSQLMSLSGADSAPPVGPAED